MLTRNVVLVVLLSLFVLLVEGDLDSNDVGKPQVSTDKDSTSDEAPTESMNVISPDQPDVISSSSEIADAPTANQATAPEPSVAAANSVEDEDEDESATSGEGGKKKLSSRSAAPPQVQQSPRLLLPISPAHGLQSPTLLSPQLPQPKALVRSRASKRRSRTNRRQI